MDVVTATTTAYSVLTLLLATIGIAINVFFFFSVSHRWRMFAFGNVCGFMVIVWIFVRHLMGVFKSFNQWEQIVVILALGANTIILYYQTKQDTKHRQIRRDKVQGFIDFCTRTINDSK